jgi:hypothetical protein
MLLVLLMLPLHQELSPDSARRLPQTVVNGLHVYVCAFVVGRHGQASRWHFVDMGAIEGELLVCCTQVCWRSTCRPQQRQARLCSSRRLRAWRRHPHRYSRCWARGQGEGTGTSWGSSRHMQQTHVYQPTPHQTRCLMYS